MKSATIEPKSAPLGILSEDVISIAEARDELTPILGVRLDRTTLWRWTMRGVGGVRLEHLRIGGRVVTSKQAITRFVAARSQATA